MRVFVSEFKQESNSFNPIQTDMNRFEQLEILRGSQLFEIKSGLHIAVKGLADAIRDGGGEPVAGIAMCSGSGGPVVHAVADCFLTEAIAMIRKSQPIDGVFLSLHGATLSEKSNDVCGYILEQIRHEVGEQAVISIALDLHANITERMLRNTDFIAGFHTYPHLDFYETGYRAGKTGMLRLNGHHIHMARAAVPMIVAASDYTLETESLHALMKKGDDMVQNNSLADYSVFQVQPWLDVPEISSSIVTVAEDVETAKCCADALAVEEFALRGTLRRTYFRIEQTIARALANRSGKPVVLVDAADSPNAGATCDSADVLRKLLPYRDELTAAFSLNDPQAVEQAQKMGIGQVGMFTLGAHLAPGLTEPVTFEARVKSLHDGQFHLQGPALRGGACSIGQSAVLTCGRLQILVCGNATKNGDLQFYRGFGIEPSLCDLVVVKACTSFRATYEPIASEICYTQTMGAANADLDLLPYRNLPSPLYPFSAISAKDIVPAACYRP